MRPASRTHRAAVASSVMAVMMAAPSAAVASQLPVGRHLDAGQLDDRLGSAGGGGLLGHREPVGVGIDDEHPATGGRSVGPERVAGTRMAFATNAAGTQALVPSSTQEPSSAGAAAPS